MRPILGHLAQALGTSRRRLAPRVAEFHASRVALKGRRTGSKAHLKPVKKTRRKVPQPKNFKEHGKPGWRVVARRKADEAREELKKRIGLNPESMKEIKAIMEGRDPGGEPLNDALADVRTARGDQSLSLATGAFMNYGEETLEAQLSACVAKYSSGREAYSVARVKFAELARQQGEPDEQSYLALLRCAARAKAFEDSFAIADAAYAAYPAVFSEPVIATHVVTALVQVCADTFRPTSAWSVWDAAHESGIVMPHAQPEAYAAMMKCCAHQKLPERALGLLEDMQRHGAPRDAEHYVEVLKAVGEAPQWHEEYGFLADDVLDQMEGDQVRPTLPIYHALIRAAGLAGDSLAVNAYFAEVAAKGFQRRLTTYTHYFAALARCQTVGIARGTKFRCIPKAPWALIGHESPTISNALLETKAEDVAEMYPSEEDFGQGFKPKTKRAGRQAIRTLPDHKIPGYSMTEDDLDPEDREELYRKYRGQGLDSEEDDPSALLDDAEDATYGAASSSSSSSSAAPPADEDESVKDELPPAGFFEGPTTAEGAPEAADEGEMTDEEFDDFFADLRQRTDEAREAAGGAQLDEATMRQALDEAEAKYRLKDGLGKKEEEDKFDAAEYDDIAAAVDRHFNLKPPDAAEAATAEAIQRGKALADEADEADVADFAARNEAILAIGGKKKKKKTAEEERPATPPEEAEEEDGRFYNAEGESIDEARAFMESANLEDDAAAAASSSSWAVARRRQEPNDVADLDPETASPLDFFRLSKWNVTRLRDLEYDALATGMDGPTIFRRQEANIAEAAAVYEAMVRKGTVRPDLWMMNAYFSVHTEAYRTVRARRVLEEEFPRQGVVADDRTHRHVVKMLSRLNQWENCVAALDGMEDPDVEAIGQCLDVVSRKGQVDVALDLAGRLAAAHKARSDRGMGAGNKPPIKIPEFAADQIVACGGPDPRSAKKHPEWRKPYGPPERLLKAFRRMCRERDLAQPNTLPIDPALWQRENKRLMRESDGFNGRLLRHKRAPMMRSR